MVNSILSGGLIPFGASLISKKQNSTAYLPVLKKDEQDSFSSSTQKKNNQPFIVTFAGVVDKEAQKLAKSFFTRGENLFEKSIIDLQLAMKSGQNDMVTKSVKSFVKAMNNFEKALKWFKPVIPEAEFADKANYIGTKYTDLGNMIKDPGCHQRAYELFDEAALIAEKQLYVDQQKASVMIGNRQALDHALHPLPEKNPIGFRPNSDRAVAKAESGDSHKMAQIGFYTDKNS